MKHVKTYTAAIYIAGDIQQAKHICRGFCENGLCVTIEPIDFIYTRGQESGVRVGLINYPKFPLSPDQIKAKAISLAEKLRDGLYQNAYSVVCDDITIWSDIRY